MRNFNIGTLALAVGLAFSVGAMAESMSKEQYKSLEKNLEAEYKVAKERCNSLAGNASDICVAEAKGKMNVGKAELEANYKPTVKTRYKARVAKADADYSVAIEKCDDKAGNDKDVCVKEAKAAKVHGIADAEAMKKTTEAHKDAATDKRDADYVVAVEKCKALAGGAKDLCLSDAKVRFGQQ